FLFGSLSDVENFCSRFIPSFKYFEYKYSIYSLLCDAVALAGAHFVAFLKLCFYLYHLLLFKMRIADLSSAILILKRFCVVSAI
ncbi:hypothetical protein, partial [Microcystis sp. M122S2]|uniref:hypothetical protein n=1 Tax=Microcystis sp. M122S2 TaxID=2771142 RepID=UPI00258CC696